MSPNNWLPTESKKFYSTPTQDYVMKKDYDVELSKLRIALNAIGAPRLCKPVRENFPNNKTWGEAMDIAEARFADCEREYTELSNNFAKQRKALTAEFWADVCKEFRWNLLPPKIRVRLIALVESSDSNSFGQMYDEAYKLSELSDVILSEIFF